MLPLTAQGVLWLITGLQMKHVICDGPLQTPAMISGKLAYGNMFGLVHAAIHLAVSLVVLLVLGVPTALAAGLALADGVIHYHIDFGKEQFVKARGFTSRDRAFWWVLAADQGLHHLTYIGMVAILVHRYA